MSSVSLGYPLWCDGQEWTSLLSRQFAGGVAVWDTNASATAVNPLGGVIGDTGNSLQVVQQVSANMSVLVNAGYVAVPHPTAQHGVYLFGLQDQSTLTIASNGAGSNRLDLIVARVYDLGSGSSYCDIEVVPGTAGSGQPATPSASLLLAVVTVAPSATSITNSNISDKRTYTVAPGGILPATTAAAPALAPGQVVWNTSLSLLQRLAAPITYTQSWTAAGTYTWTFPALVSSVQANGTGAGSAGGGSSDSNPGGAAGGGEYAADTITGTAGVTVLTITVGAGGDPSPAGDDSPGTGTASTVTGGSVELEANPGQPGGADGGAQATVAPAAPTPSTMTAARVAPGPRAGGGGGGSGGPGSAGLRGQRPAGYRGAQGAPAVPGGGPGGQGGEGAFGGPGYAPATGPGGGGGGTADQEDPSGGGADGQVTFTWTVQPAQLTPVFSTDSADDDLSVTGTSTGTSGSSGLSPASGSNYGWGIGYGSTEYTGFFGYGFDADGAVAPQIQVEFDADGATDFQIDAKWGLAVPEAAVDASSPSIGNGQCRIILYLDGTVLDAVYLTCSASGGVTRPGDGGSWTYYTSAQNGTTPGSGTHIADPGRRDQEHPVRAAFRRAHRQPGLSRDVAAPVRRGTGDVLHERAHAGELLACGSPGSWRARYERHRAAAVLRHRAARSRLPRLAITATSRPRSWPAR